MVIVQLKRLVMGPAIVLILVSLLTVFSVRNATAASLSSSFSFKNFELRSVTGTNCPNTNATCPNNAAEPQIRADNAGNFYAPSENALGAVTEAWQPTSAGQAFVAL